MTDESGPINKGKYWRTEFEGLKPYVITTYNNGYEDYHEMEYYLVRRFSDEDENDEGLTFIGKDYVVQVTKLDNKAVTFFAVYSRRVYVDDEGKESFEGWNEAFNADISGSYMNEYEYEAITENFTFTKEQVNSGVDENGDKFEIYQLKPRPQVPKESILLPSMRPMRNAIVAEVGPEAAVARIQNVVRAQARNRRRHALIGLSRSLKARQEAASKKNKGGGRTLKKRRTKSRRNGLRRL